MIAQVSKVLIVEDSVTQATQMRMLLEGAGCQVIVAGNGLEGLNAVRTAHPNLVLTDLRMPEMDGLEFVRAVREHADDLPVVLTTAEGSEDIAAEALRNGAASFVPKACLTTDLLPTVRRLLALVDQNEIHRELIGSVVSNEICYKLPNNPQLVPPVVMQLKEHVRLMNLCNEMELMQLASALDEALLNAVLHGNLEISSQLRELDGEMERVTEERRRQPPYADRSVHVTSHINRDEATFVIRDEGPGFDVATLPDPTDPANLDKPSGRGLLLISTFMDEVRHNGAGNEITMIKRKSM